MASPSSTRCLPNAGSRSHRRTKRALPRTSASSAGGRSSTRSTVTRSATISRDCPTNCAAPSRALIEVCFGDFYTRSGLDLALPELLVLCVLAALGGADAQVRAHAAGNLRAGNTVDVQIAAMIHCLPYIGFPRALNAIRAISQLAQSE